VTPCAAGGAVAEIQGPYGTLSVAEVLVQKIWLSGDFAGDGLRCASGRPLRILTPGRWNPAEGPDFKEARLRLGERVVTGDVEVHFYARDWAAHNHGRDPRYAGVVLHVLLFPQEPGEPPARTCDGREPEAFVLLPHLNRDLEEYAAEDALLRLEGRDQLDLVEALLSLPEAGRTARMSRARDLRWQQKRAYARKRLERAGSFAEAAHGLCLECLGLTRNRPAMSAVAARWPLERMLAEKPGVEALLEAGEGRWIAQNIRPANQPRRRIEQYRALLVARPDWPARVLAALRLLPCEDINASFTRDFRARLRKQGFPECLREEAMAAATGGTRFDTLVTDVLLPLGSVALGRDLGAAWMHWWGGDYPPALGRFLQQCGYARAPGRPLCNGLYQGALHMLFAGGRG